MRWLFTVILFLIVLTVQAAAAPYLERHLFGASPNLLIILVVQVALVAPTFEAVVGAWLMGLATDLNGDGPPGMLAFTWGLAALGYARIRKDLFAEHILTRAVLVAAAAAFQEGVIVFSRVLRGHAPGFLLTLKYVALVTLWTTLASLVLLPLFGLILKRVFTWRRDA